MRRTSSRSSVAWVGTTQDGSQPGTDACHDWRCSAVIRLGTASRKLISTAAMIETTFVVEKRSILTCPLAPEALASGLARHPKLLPRSRRLDRGSKSHRPGMLELLESPA